MKHPLPSPTPAAALVLAALALVSGCAEVPLTRDTGLKREIDQTLRAGSTPAAPAPAPAAAAPEPPRSLLPPLRSAVPRPQGAAAEPRFDLMVTDAPVNQVLQAIVADTRYSVMLSPRLTQPSATQPAAPEPRRDLLTVQLKNVTVFEALDAVRDAYGYEYTVTGTRIVVEPPELQTRFFQVNYTLGQRRGVSDIAVVAGASSSGGGGGGSGGNSGGGNSGGGNSGNGNSGGGSSYASTQASAMTTLSKADFWGELEDSVRTALGCQIPKLQATATRAATGAAAAGGGSRADVSFTGEAAGGERLRGVEGCTDGRAVNVNQMSGTVLVRAMPRELRQIDRLLRAMQVNVERQVIIEAKIIDVQLNQESQRGINWAAFRNGTPRFSVGAAPNAVRSAGTSSGGAVYDGASIGDVLGQAVVGTVANTAFNAGLGIAIQGANFAQLMSFLESQGQVQVLSSPRIATLNNQKAVIKVGTEEPFITAITPGTTAVSTTSAIATPPTLTYQPFFAGISLDVTPQIDDRDRVTLHVHALVNSIVEKNKPSSTQAGAAAVPLAVNSVNETDSVIKTADGTMVVIGGLMTESSNGLRAAVPGLGTVPGAGALFRKGELATTKRELVILIKPTVVKSEADWQGDIGAAGRRIGAMADRGRTD